MNNVSHADPLEDKHELLTNNPEYRERNISYNFIEHVGKLGSHSKHFTVQHIADDKYDSPPLEEVNWADFTEGKIDTNLGLYLKGGKLHDEPLARWKGSLLKNTPINESKETKLKNSGSIVLTDFFTQQIVKEYNTYFSAKKRLEKSTPNHPMLKKAPSFFTEEHVGEMLWLQYWNIALKRRDTKTYPTFRKTLSFTQRVALVHSDLPLDKKIILSELNLLTPQHVEEYKEIPNEWIFRMTGKEDNITTRDILWAVPELHLGR